MDGVLPTNLTEYESLAEAKIKAKGMHVFSYGSTRLATYT